MAGHPGQGEGRGQGQVGVNVRWTLMPSSVFCVLQKVLRNLSMCFSFQGFKARNYIIILLLQKNTSDGIIGNKLETGRTIEDYFSSKKL